MLCNFDKYVTVNHLIDELNGRAYRLRRHRKKFPSNLFVLDFVVVTVMAHPVDPKREAKPLKAGIDPDRITDPPPPCHCCPAPVQQTPAQVG